MVILYTMNDITDKIIDRINRSDEKIDENMFDLRKEVMNCKLNIQAVQKDLTYHLENKKDELESSVRRFYIVTIIIGMIFTTYTVIKELL